MLYRPRLKNGSGSGRPGCLVAFRTYDKEIDRFCDAVEVPAGEVMVATGEKFEIFRSYGKLLVLGLYSPSAGLVWAFRDYVVRVRQKKVSEAPVQVG